MQTLREESSSKLSLSTLLDIVAPVLQQFILEGKAAEDSGHEIKQVNAVHEQVKTSPDLAA